MKQPQLPQDSNAWENEFNYSNWGADTIVTCCNVPWDSTYRDVVRFDDQAARDLYFESLTADSYTFRLKNVTYLKYGEPIRINAPFGKVMNCNYLVVENPTIDLHGQPNKLIPDKIYYFLNDPVFIAPNTTQINVQVDVWQTFYQRIQFDKCYVTRSHISIANQNSDQNNTADYLTDLEGFDIGNEYETTDIVFENLMQEPPYIVLMSTADLTAPFGTIDKPNLKTATGGIYDSIPNGANCYVMTSSAFVSLMGYLSSYPWISQCITFISVIPRAMVPDLGTLDSVTIGGITIRKLDGVGGAIGINIELENIPAHYNIPARYKTLYKFLTHPYSFIQMTTLTGGDIVLKNECFKNLMSAFVIGMSVVSPPSLKLLFTPRNYNGLSGITSWSFKTASIESSASLGGDEMDAQVSIGNFPQLSLVTNQYLNYLASNAHVLDYAKQSADWSQQKALRGADLAFDQTTHAMDTTLANQAISNSSAWTQNQIALEQNMWGGVQGVAGGVAGAIGGAAIGNAGAAGAGLASAATAGINTALNADWTNRSTANSVNTANALTASNLANTGFNRDTNREYAQFATRGDYAQAIAGIQAKVQDAKLTQPSTAGQNGGELFNFARGFIGVAFKFKRLKENYLRQIGDYWLRYGCITNRWITPPADLKCMENFTYWEMKNVSLSGTPMPEMFKQAIRGIFERGTTVWNDPRKINRIDFADNKIVEGIKY